MKTHQRNLTYDLQDAVDQQLQEDAANCLSQEGSSLHAPVKTVKISGQLQNL